LVRAARKVLALGPQAIIVKKGAHGAALFYKSDHSLSQYFFTPAYPLEQVADPTGAGDTFAAGFVGYLAKHNDTSLESLKRAIVHGSVVASFTVEDFSIGRLKTLTQDDIKARYTELQHFTHFENW
jgi:sugar/nucleoside kinase (ribokinase family)